MTLLRHHSEGRRLDAMQIVEAVRLATREVEPVLRAVAREQAQHTASLVPRRRGTLASSVRGQVRRRRYGYVLRVAPGKGEMQVRARGRRTTHERYDLFYGWFVEHGTGVRGPRRQLIPPRQRGLVPAGSRLLVPSGIGQAPQRPFGRARDHYDRVVARRLDRKVQQILDHAVTRAITRGSAR